MSDVIYDRVEIEGCMCGHPGCSDVWLVGVGKFVQGSGFTKFEAETLTQLINHTRRIRAFQQILDTSLEPEERADLMYRQLQAKEDLLEYVNRLVREEQVL